MVDLAGFTTESLIDEVARRHRVRERRKPNRYCDDCQHWQSQKKRCVLGHKTKFRDPDDMGEAVYGHYGWYRHGYLACPDSTEAS